MTDDLSNEHVHIRVLQALPSTVAYWDGELRCRFANSAYEAWFGVKASEVIGKTLAELLGPQLFALNEPYVRAAFRGETQRFARVVPHANGSRRYGLAHYIPDIQHGQVVGFTVQVTDVTELHHARLAVLAEHERSTAAFEQLQRNEGALREAQRLGNIGSWEWEIEPDVVRWSEQLYTIFGRDPRLLPPSYAEHGDLYTPESWMRLQRAVTGLLKTGQAFKLHLEYWRPDGSTGWIEGRGAAQTDGTGRITRLYGTTREISAERLSSLLAKRRKRIVALQRKPVHQSRVQDRLEAALAQAKKLEVLGLLAGGIAHDFNNVLTAVLASFQLIKRRTADQASLDLASRGIGAVDRAARLVQQLMGFARSRETKVQTVDVGALLQSYKSLLELTTGPTIPVYIEVGEPVHAMLDASQLEVALLNLAINARDAMPTGGTLRITLSRTAAEKRGDDVTPRWLKIAVADTGCGMDESTLARAREPFYTTKGEGEGTGLGLAMVSAFVERNGGTLLLDSAVGVGTTATILLPSCDLAGGSAYHSDPEEAVDRTIHGDAHILVVDDDDLVRPGIAHFLSDLGYQVQAVDSARKALAVARSDCRLDLVLTDLAMADMNGEQLVQQLRSIRPGIKTLLMSGRPAACSDASVLLKPFKQAELAFRILQALRTPAVRYAEVRQRIQHPEMLALYDDWAHDRGDPYTLEHFAALEASGTTELSSLFVLEVKGTSPLQLRRLHCGGRVDDHINRLFDFGFAVDEGDRLFAGQQAGYRRCVMLRVPVHEQLTVQRNAQAPALYERLLLPCAAPNGRPMYLIGMTATQNL